MGIFSKAVAVPDDALRPQTWDDYIGQEALKTILSVTVEAARAQHRRIDHVLLIGTPGCGKTTLAEIMASTLGVRFTDLLMPIKDETLIRTVQTAKGIVLLDEIHRAAPSQQEMLLTLIEDDYIVMGNGRKIQANGRIAFVGATTEPDRIIAPLYGRFPLKPSFASYTDEELARIIQGMGSKIGLNISDEDAIALGSASGGIPRNAKNIVFMLRDLTETNRDTSIDNVLNMCELTRDGLTKNHVRYLTMLEAAGGSAGLQLLCTHLRLPKPIVLDLERLLIDQGRIEYSKNGRQLIRAIEKEGVDNADDFWQN
jgi:Holliday junction DNA helicase RuvB